MNPLLIRKQHTAVYWLKADVKMLNVKILKYQENGKN
jgi:hypothetical protein